MPSSFASPTSASVQSADLRGPSRHLRAGGIADGLDGIDRQEERTGLACHLEHVRQIAPGRERDRVAGDAEPPGARRHLRMGLLAGYQHA